MRKEKNPWWHYWATHWAVARNFQCCEIINFPRGKSRLEILSLTPGSVLTGTSGKQPQFYSHVDYFFLLKSIFQGPLFPLGLGENGYTLIVVWKKLWFEGLATSNSQPPPPMKWDVHFMKYPKGMGLTPECEGGLVNFLFCVSQWLVKKWRNAKTDFQTLWCTLKYWCLANYAFIIHVKIQSTLNYAI